MRRGVCFQFAQSGECSYGDVCKYRHIDPDFNIAHATAPAKARQTKKARSRRRKRTPASDTLLASDTPLDDFFAEFPYFEYNPRGSASQEFYRLCDQSAWGRHSRVHKNAHSRFKDALVLQFNETYGTEVDSLRSWQALAQVIGIDPIPETLEVCQAAVETSNVNIVDLVDARHEDSEVIVHNFATELELSEYTRKWGKYFPKEHAYAGGLLQYLLRHIFHPDASRGSGVYRTGRRLERRRNDDAYA